MSEVSKNKPGRPRSNEAHHAILNATLSLLIEVGFQALSIEQVAVQAGVSKMTIYRRWSSKETLVSDAIRSIQAEMPVVDTGNLRDDLTAMYRTALQGVDTNPAIRVLYLRMFSEWSSNPALFEVFLAQLVLPRFQQFVAVVEKSRARGEIRHDINLEVVIDLLVGPVLFRWIARDLLSSASLDTESFIEELVTLLLLILAAK